MTEQVQGSDETINLDYELDLAFMHSVPRFGHSHNIAHLASPDIDRRWDYINGVVLFCIFVMSFFMMWACAQIVLKAMGMKRVGCASGRAIHMPDNISKCGGRIHKKHQKIQFAFLFLCCAVFAGGSVLLKNGLPPLNMAVTETLALNQDVNISLEKGLGVANSGNLIRSSLITSTTHEVLLSDSYCVNSNSNVASLLLNGTYDEESMTVFANFRDKLRGEEVSGVQSGIQQIADNLQHFNNILVFYNSYHWIVRMLVVMLFNICLFLMISIILTLSRKDHFPPLKCMTSYFILPFFITLVFALWLFMLLFAAGSIMNSDFCVGSGEGPDSTVQNALLENGFNVADLTYKSFMYYKSGCTVDEPWNDTVTEYRELIKEGTNVATFVLSRINSLGATNLMNICGRDFQPVINAIDKTLMDLMAFTHAIDEAVELGRCDRVMPVYERFFNGPTCKESLAGLSWSFYSLFAVCIGGIMIFSLRSALYHIKVFDNDDSKSLDESKIEEKGERAIGKTLTIDSGDSGTISIAVSNSHDIGNALPTVLSRCSHDGEELKPLTPPSAAGSIYSTGRHSSTGKYSYDLNDSKHSPSSFISSSLSGSFDSFV